MSVLRRFYIGGGRRRGPIWLPNTHGHINRVQDDGGEVSNKQKVDQMKRQLRLAGLEPEILISGLSTKYDAVRRISRAYDLTSNERDANQDTGADQPELSRADGRMNLATHSRFPGTLGESSPNGWSNSQGSGDGGTVLTSELVASDDGSNDHQSYRTELDNARSRLDQSIDVAEGMELIHAVYLEHDGWVSGETRMLAALVGLASTTLEAESEVDGTKSGTWLWRTDRVDDTGTGTYRVGIGSTGASNHATGDFRFSRPIAIYRPTDWGSKTEAQRQQYLTDHYAASGPDHQEFPGFRGMRVPHFKEQQMFFDLPVGAPDELSLALFCYNHGPESAITMLSNRDAGNNRLVIDGFGRILYRLTDDDGVNQQVAAFSSEWANFTHGWHLFTGTAKVGEPMRLYLNDTLFAEGDVLGSKQVMTDEWRLGFAAHSAAWSFTWVMPFNRRLTQPEIATINNFIRGT